MYSFRSQELKTWDHYYRTCETFNVILLTPRYRSGSLRNRLRGGSTTKQKLNCDEDATEASEMLREALKLVGPLMVDKKGLAFTSTSH